MNRGYDGSGEGDSTAGMPVVVHGGSPVPVPRGRRPGYGDLSTTQVVLELVAFGGGAPAAIFFELGRRVERGDIRTPQRVGWAANTAPLGMVRRDRQAATCTPMGRRAEPAPRFKARRAQQYRGIEGETVTVYAGQREWPATKPTRLWSILTPQELSVMRKRLADAVAAHDHMMGVGCVDLAVAYDAIDAAGELMRQLDASGELMRGDDTDACQETLS